MKYMTFDFDDVTMYLEEKEKLEKKLKRKLTNDEERELYDEVLNSLWKDTEIPAEEISDEEIAALKD